MKKILIRLLQTEQEDWLLRVGSGEVKAVLFLLFNEPTTPAYDMCCNDHAILVVVVFLVFFSVAGIESGPSSPIFRDFSVLIVGSSISS